MTIRGSWGGGSIKNRAQLPKKLGLERPKTSNFRRQNFEILQDSKRNWNFFRVLGENFAKFGSILWFCQNSDKKNDSFFPFWKNSEKFLKFCGIFCINCVSFLHKVFVSLFIQNHLTDVLAFCHTLYFSCGIYLSISIKSFSLSVHSTVPFINVESSMIYARCNRILTKFVKFKDYWKIIYNNDNIICSTIIMSVANNVGCQQCTIIIITNFQFNCLVTKNVFHLLLSNEILKY